MKAKSLALLGAIELPLPPIIDGQAITIQDNEKDWRVFITVIAWLVIWILWLYFYFELEGLN